MAIQNRSEILFLYDVSYSNPNGDPADSNRPRQDPFNEHLLVTDVRLKRTIRDYLYTKYRIERKDTSCDLFVYSDQADPMTLDERLKGFETKEKKFTKENLLAKCIDARLFGIVSAPKQAQETKDEEKVFHLTGPVQFNMGRSLHPAKVEFIKGTGAFATKEEREQRTFREEFVAAYGLIAFYGCIDHHRAEFTQCSEGDVDKLLEAIWCGTMALNTRSKAGQVPRLLLKIDTKNDFLFGRLTRFIKIEHEGKNGNELRSTDDFTLNLDALLGVLKDNGKHVAKVSFNYDKQLKLSTEKLPQDWEAIKTEQWYA